MLSMTRPADSGTPRRKNFLTFRKILLIHLITASAVPVLFLFWVTVITSTKSISEKYIKEAEIAINSSQRQLESELKDMVEAYNTLHRFYDNAYYDIGREGDGKTLSRTNVLRMNSFLDSLQRSFDLRGIRLFLYDKEYVPGSLEIPTTKVRDMSHFERHTSEMKTPVYPSFVTWISPYFSTLTVGGDLAAELISFVSPLVMGGGTPLEPTGWAIMDKRADLLYDLLPRDTASGESLSFIIDNSNHPIFIGRGMEAAQEIAEIARRMIPLDGGEDPSEFDSWFVLSRPLNNTGWRLYYLLPKSYAILQSISYSRFSIAALLASVLLSVMLVLSLTNYLKSRLNPLIEAIDKGALDEDELIPHLPIHGSGGRRDAIDSMAASYNKMSQRLESMIDQLYVAEHKALHYHMEALQSQINPHFLYNKLEGIQSNIALSKPERAMDIIRELSGYLRKVLSQKNEENLIKDEIELVQGYLKLVKLVYRLDYDLVMSVDESLQECYVIKFSLQPIIENCIVHGFDNKKGRLSLELDAYLQDGDMVFSVKDRGKGMPPDRLKEINGRLKSSDTHNNSIGLTNIQARFKLLYGGSYGLSLSGNTPSGVTTLLKFPVKRNV